MVVRKKFGKGGSIFFLLYNHTAGIVVFKEVLVRMDMGRAFVVPQD